MLTGMRVLAEFLRRQDRVTFLVIVLVAGFALLAMPMHTSGTAGKPAHPAGNPDLAVAWSPDNRSLRITAYGYRARSPAEVRVGSQPWTPVRTDNTGTVRLEVPADLVAAGRPGSSVIVTGRASAGTTRVLVAALPPRAAARGPIDLLPWTVGAALVLALALAVVRRTRRSRATAAPLAPAPLVPAPLVPAAPVRGSTRSSRSRRRR